MLLKRSVDIAQLSQSQKYAICIGEKWNFTFYFTASYIKLYCFSLLKQHCILKFSKFQQEKMSGHHFCLSKFYKETFLNIVDKNIILSPCLILRYWYLNYFMYRFSGGKCLWNSTTTKTNNFTNNFQLFPRNIHILMLRKNNKNEKKREQKVMPHVGLEPTT